MLTKNPVQPGAMGVRQGGKSGGKGSQKPPVGRGRSGQVHLLNASVCPGVDRSLSIQRAMNRNQEGSVAAGTRGSTLDQFTHGWFL